jgi:hypothetical protein
MYSRSKLYCIPLKCLYINKVIETEPNFTTDGSKKKAEILATHLDESWTHQFQ